MSKRHFTPYSPMFSRYTKVRKTDVMKNIFQASEDNDMDAVAMHLRLGMDVNARDGNGMTPLLIAAKHGNFRVAELMVREGADIHLAKPNGNSPLYVATYWECKDIVSFLLRVGAEVNQANKKGWTALHAAVQDDSMELAELLLQRGANPFAETSKFESVLSIAAAKSKVPMVAMLLEKTQSSINIKDNFSRTLLFSASERGQKQTVDFLLEQDACVNAASAMNETPLFAAAKGGHEEIVETLLENGADINCVDWQGQSALFEASHQGHIEIADILLTAGAKVDDPRRDGMTPLHAAIESGCRKTVALLLQHGASVNVTTENGDTALAIAAIMGDAAAAKLILHYDPLQLDEEMHLARRHGASDVVLAIHRKKQPFKVLRRELRNLVCRQGERFESARIERYTKEVYAKLQAQVALQKKEVARREAAALEFARQIAKTITDSSPKRVAALLLGNEDFEEMPLDVVAISLVKEESKESIIRKLAEVDIKPDFERRLAGRVCFWKEHLSDGFVCEICMNEYMPGESANVHLGLVLMPMKNCNHAEKVCQSCLSVYVKDIAMKDQAYIHKDGIRCWNKHCTSCISVGAARDLLDHDEAAKLKSMMLTKAVEQDPRSRWCSNAKCGAIIQHATCSQCSVKTCLECGQAEHSGKTCEANMDAVLHGLIAQKKWMRCPCCSVIVEKTMACDHITCRCGGEFCYRCGRVGGTTCPPNCASHTLP
eukprot:g1982.t1